MNKSERLNAMLIYLNNKSYFNLSDLMEKYNISKSTALRDIQSLEMIGMPIFAEHGRYGRYGILGNRLLSPIIFSIDEMYAMYFSMLTLKGFQATPFDLDLQKLNQKFEACISKKHKSNLARMETVLNFFSAKQVNKCPLLKDILYSAISNTVNDINYKRANINYLYTVQFLKVSSSFGQWYVTAYNHKSEKLQVFRCDKIFSLSVNEKIRPIKTEKAKKILKKKFKNDNATDFEVAITDKGVDIFIKENYPSMTLIYTKKTPIIKGYYNKDEENFISNYFLSYGKEITAIKPTRLKKLIIKKLADNLSYLNHI
ncbi:WYL domain-containing protein [Liquorilactobacillus satsumensis]|uniref:helix-turn-helix transcriptional regulator n=4 Tax=Liquorilactobacillus satsumensis TaxID=259059 RepID=UPI0021C2C1F5|nr:WYL domain-containing protein [Liquorilactobacillus satsumensis]MCP9312031.1 WYL domain-containing protein [Liquorilactobacillus satsumensis]MCP9359165.1 WYL domain-containing protein [Liquorilactobacillus satsumensis]